MALSSLLNVARDALTAQTFGVSVTSQNITNANTPGYVRREAILASRVLGNQTYGTVVAIGIKRNQDSFIAQKFLSATGMGAAATERDQELQQIEALFNDMSGAGIGEALDRINASFQQLSVDPGDAISRENVLTALAGFTGRLNETGNALAVQRTEIFNQMQNQVSDLNEKAVQIADLNKKIAEAVVLGNDAADLKDRRNQIIVELSNIVDIKLVEGKDGALFVQAAGATLVEGDIARSFGVELASNGDVRLTARRTPTSSATDVTGGLNGGTLAGLKETRDVDLRAIASKLDTFVYDFATAMNTQHAAGFGLDGGTGRNLFDLNLVGAPPDGASRTISLSVDVAGQPNRIAASDSALTLPGSGVNAKAITQLFDQPVLFGGTRTASEGYSDIIGDVGLRRANSKGQMELRSAMQAQFSELNDAASGVSLDEEMVNLTKFQRAYQAATKVLATVDELLQELIQRV